MKTLRLMSLVGMVLVLAVPSVAAPNRARQSAGNVLALGYNVYGQLGNGTTTGSSTPVQASGLSGVAAIAGGFGHTLTLKSDGTVWASGWNFFGQLGNDTNIGTDIGISTPIQVSSLSGVVAIAGGAYHSLALKSDGTVWAWGYNVNGQLGNGATVDSRTPVQVSSLSGVVAIAGGIYHSLALKSDGTIWAWGYNGEGELGDGTLTNSSTPIQVSSLSGMVSIEGGGFHSVALKSDGTVWSWGYNGYGQFGDGTTTNSSTPVQASALSGVASIAAGTHHTLALKSDGTVWGSGYNVDGELGNATATSSSTPVQASDLSGVASIASGDFHSLALKSDGTVWAWGSNGQGQLGNGAAGISITPVPIIGLSGVVAIAGGSNHTLALQSQTIGEAWGNNSEGELGNGTTTSSSAPIQVSSLSGVVAIAGGTYHSLALKSDGSVWSWGFNGQGQLGNGTTIQSATPVDVSTVSGAVAVAGGWYHSLALKSDGTVWSWGYNGFGQLGNGTTTDSSTPLQVSTISNVVAIAAGTYHSLALKSDGTIWTWGYNAYGQLGDGTVTNRSMPVQVSSLAGMIAVAGGGYNSMALKSDGTVWAWGENCCGQIGDNTIIQRNTPVQVTGLSGVFAIAAGFEHSLAIKSDGTVWTWGYNAYGQLGNGTTTNSSTALQVNSLSGVTAIGGGVYHNVALKNDGTVRTWGYNGSGQLGNGTNTDSSTPVQVSGLSTAVAAAAGGYHSLALAVSSLIPGALDHFAVSASTSTPNAGVAFSVTVTARDAFNSTVTGYTGTVHFTLTNPDAGATLPADYTFVAGDNGSHTFASGVNLTVVGAQSLNVNDTVQTSVIGNAGVTVVLTMVTVTGAGSGSGTVTGTGGINCTIISGATSGTCTNISPISTGATVTLLAAPQSGSVFAGWSGACSENGSCSFTMGTAPVSVGATFNNLAPVIVSDFDGSEDKQALNGASPPLRVTLTNTSATLMVNITSVTGNNENFTTSTTCEALGPGQSCTVFVSYLPQSVCQNDFVTITVNDDDPGGPASFSVLGWGSDGHIQVDDLTDPNLSAQALAQALVGQDVAVSNAQYTGARRAAGTFSSPSNIIGFPGGVVLSTGSARNVVGPNCSSSITVASRQPGDSDLSLLSSGETTNDAAVLEFDFVPASSVLTFQYVFASDEYNEFVFSFNDVFGFFVNGQNVALIPGTNQPVSINNVNGGNPLGTNPMNPQFYVNNDFQYPAAAPVDAEMDGLTTVLTAQVQVNPGVTNHIKLAIADAGDDALDSNIFIKAGSLSSSAVTLTPATLAFANQGVNTSSAAKQVSVVNTGSAVVIIGNITASVGFSENNNCPAQLAPAGQPGSTCTIDVTFNPPSAGSFSGAVTLSDDSPTAGSQQSISVSGFGVASTLDHFAVSPFTSTPNAGVAFSVTVSARDAFNSTVTGYTGTVHFSISNPDAGATLPADYTFVAGDNGTRTFASGVNLTVVGAQSLNVNDTAQTGVMGSASITVLAPVSVTVAPSLITMLAGSAQRFTATVSNTTNTAVTWSVNGIVGGNATVGTIDASGLYSAPASSGTVNINATSVAEPSKSASATVFLIFASTPALVADYQFANVYTSSVGEDPALVDIGPGTNAFATAIVRGASQSVLVFPAGNGLQLSPTTGLFANAVYTVAALVRLDSTSGYRRILDFKNASSDTGLYNLNGALDFFGATSGSSAPIAAGAYVQVVLTRATDGTVTGYVNGAQQFAFADSSNLAVIDSADVLRFFKDDNAVTNENSGGAVARIRIWNGALTAAQVAALEPAPTADLSVSVVPAGGSAATVTITNLGPASAANVVLTDTLDRFGFISATPSQGGPCTFAAPVVTCPLGALAAGGSATVIMIVTAPSQGWAAQSLKAVSDALDPNPTNNAARLGPSLSSFNTPTGANVVVTATDSSGDAATVSFASVTRVGSTTISASAATTAAPAGFRFGTPAVIYDISSNADFAAPITVALRFNPASFHHPAKVRLFHFENGFWVDRTTGVNLAAATVLAVTSTLSPFIVVEPLNNPPVANAGAAQALAGLSATGAAVKLDATSSSDADGDALTYRWTGPFPEGNGVVTGATPTVTVPLGASTVNLIVNDGENDSAPAAVSVTVADFLVAANSAAVSVKRGQSTTLTIAVSPKFAAYGDAVALSCPNLPAGVTCSFSPAAITPGASGASATLTITTTASVAGVSGPGSGRRVPPPFAFWLATLAPFGLVWTAGLRRRRTAVTLALMLLLLIGLAACGGGGITNSASSQPPTPSSTVTITIAGTSSSLQHSTTVPLTLQ